MSMILDENDYERIAAHQRAASRAAVSRADENEKLKERIKELEAEVKRWKPRPMSEEKERKELHEAVAQVVDNWADKHDLQSRFYTVESDKTITIRFVDNMGGFEILEDYATAEESSEDRTVKESKPATPTPLIPLKKLEALRELYPDHEWIAMDEDKAAYLHQVESPIEEWCMWSNDYACIHVATLDSYAPNWRESLIHIPTEIERIKGLEGNK